MSNRRIRIIHIFDNDKFINGHISNIEKGDFDNEFIFLKEEFTYKGNYSLIHIKPNSKDYIDLIKRCELFDIMIIYFLSGAKVDLVNSLNSNRPKIIWSFYGAELYNLPAFRRGMLSDETNRILKKNNGMASVIKNVARSLYDKIGGFGVDFERGALSTMKKIDYFSWYDKGEYNFLNDRLNGHLPEFLQSSLSTEFNQFESRDLKLRGILLGNSANPYNNHIDILKLLESHAYRLKITIPMSYPRHPAYIENIKSFCMRANLDVDILEEFIQFESYGYLISQHTTAIFNSYRQMGLGNIVIALKCGLRVYLSCSNLSYRWLSELGFLVFCIEQNLEDDLIANRLVLSKEEILRNRRVCDKIFDWENNSRFIEQLKIIGNTE